MAKILDLEALRPEPLVVVLGGSEHTLRPHTLTNGRKFAELQRGMSEAKEAADQLAAMQQVLAFILPGVADEVVGELSADQQHALLQFWATAGAEEAKKDAEDTKRVIEDPTSPG